MSPRPLLENIVQPPRRLPSPVVLLVAAVSVALPLATLGAQALPGWSFTTNTTVDSGGVGRTYSMATRERVTDRFLRTEFLQISGLNAAAGAEGTYMVYNTADSTVTMVMTTQRMATIMNTPSLAGMDMPKIASMTHDRPIHEDLGAGETILGHATHHYRATTRGTMAFDMGGETCSRTMDAVTDTWVAPDVDITPAYTAIMKHFPDADAMEKSVGADEHRDDSPEDRGTPLRTITRRSYTDSTGVAHTVTTTTEYVEISNAPIDATAFAVPSDFRTMDMRKTMAKLLNNPKSAAMFDSLMASGKDRARKSICR